MNTIAPDSTPGETPQSPQPETDTLGRPFDPAKFHPRFDKTGRWVNKNAGAKRKPPAPATPPDTQGGTDRPPLTPVPPPPAMDDIERASQELPPPPEKPAEPEPEPITTAETIIGIIQTALVLVGEDEGVLTPAEKILIRHPLERVLKKYDVGSDILPPEVDLAVALATVIIVRLKKPKTATFAARVKVWFGNIWMKRKGARLAHQVTDATAV